MAEKIFKRHGVNLSKSTLCHWVKKTYELLTPIGEEIRKDVINSFCVNADETHIRVLDKEKKHACHNGFIWVYVGDNSKVFIEYKKTRSRAGPSELLKNYHGYLQVDGYAGYNACVESGQIIRLGCWAHARRKFFDCEVTSPHLSEPILKIKKLYAIAPPIAIGRKNFMFCGSHEGAKRAALIYTLVLV